MKYLTLAAGAVIGLILPPNGALAQSNDVILQRLAAVEKENASLRDRVRHLKSSKRVARTEPAGLSVPGSVALAAAGPVYKATPLSPQPIYWTGFYIGGSVGYSWNRLNVNDLDYWDGFGDSSQSNHGFIGGGAAGYNWQNGALVVGIESDMSYLSNSSIANNDNNNPPPFAQIVSKINALGTLRVRGGIAVDPALLYLTGGVAFGHVSNAFNDLHRSPPETWTDSGWRAGWTFGAGLEVKGNANWSWKMEALYYQLNDNTVSVTPTTQVFRQQFSDWGVIARFGVNYQFGDFGKGPVVTRY